MMDRGTYLIKNGAVITVDPARGVLPRADVLVRDGRIERIGPDLTAAGAEGAAAGAEGAAAGAVRAAAGPVLIDATDTRSTRQT